MNDPARAYQALTEKLDEFSRRVRERHPGRFRCAPGCDDCCRRSLSLFSFEAERLARAAGRLAPRRRAGVIRRAEQTIEDPQAPCPLLEEGLCLAYAERPVICRTHGLPLLVPGEGTLSLCVHNLKDVGRLDGDCVLDLEPLNRILSTIQRLWCPAGPDRVRLGQCILRFFEGGDRR